MLAHLSRYTYRVALSNHRLVSADVGTVVLRWKDYRIKHGVPLPGIALRSNGHERKDECRAVANLHVHLTFSDACSPGPVPPHSALRPAGQRNAEGQHCPHPRPARAAPARIVSARTNRARNTHLARTMPMLRWPDAHHRDIPTWPNTSNQSTTQKAARMMDSPSYARPPVRPSPHRSKGSLGSTLSTRRHDPQTKAKRPTIMPIDARGAETPTPQT